MRDARSPATQCLIIELQGLLPCGARHRAPPAGNAEKLPHWWVGGRAARLRALRAALLLLLMHNSVTTSDMSRSLGTVNFYGPNGCVLVHRDPARVCSVRAPCHSELVQSGRVDEDGSTIVHSDGTKHTNVSFWLRNVRRTCLLEHGRRASDVLHRRPAGIPIPRAFHTTLMSRTRGMGGRTCATL